MLAVLAVCALPAPPARAQQGVASGPYWQIEVDGDLSALVVADLNGDNWAEIIAGTKAGQVTLWPAEGEPAWTFGVEADWVSGLSTGDLEGDGVQEVFVTAAGILPTSYLSVLRADGELIWSHSVRDELWGVHLLDLDGDGRQEVLLAAQRPVALDDDGSELTSWPVDALRTPYVHITDVDGDGADEVVAVNETDVTILEADGSSRAWPHGLDGPILGTGAADLDGDGRSEIGIVTESVLAVWQAANEMMPAWTLAFEEPPTGEWMGDAAGPLLALGGAVISLAEGGNEVWRFPFSPDARSEVLGLHASDPNADGSPETVFGTANGQVYLLDGHGDPLAEYPAAEPVTLVRYADLNGDGRGELVVGTGAVLSVFGSTGGPTATRLRWTYATRGAVTDLSTGDLDGDGRWEVVVGGRDRKVTLLDKDGSMVWQFPAADVVDGVRAGQPIILTGDRPFDMAYERQDEILVRAGLHLYLLAGDGALLWQRPLTSPASAIAWGVEPGSAIAAGLEDGQALAVALEDGAQQWSRPLGRAVRAIGVSENLSGMVVGLGDGRVALLDDQGHMLWEQDTGRIVTWLAVSDLDRDGRDDVVVRSGDSIFRLRPEDGAIVWRTETQAERLISVAVGDGVVVGTDQRVYMLDAVGSEVWNYPVDEVVSIVYTVLEGACDTLSSDCGLAQVAIGTVKGGIHLLDAGGQLLWREQAHERINALGAADLNGDGDQELLVGMEDGLVQAFGLAANQVPLLSAPSVVPVGDGYVYSVRARDPDGDDVQATLEIWDPSTQTWLVQETVTAPSGKGTLSWNLPSPFDTWDAGRDSRFRFSWDDGQSQGTVAAVPGPLDIPVAPWYIFYGRYVLALVLVGAIPTLLLVVLRRARAYRRSPVGQAEAFLLRLTLEPEVLLPELHRLVSDIARAMTILPHLPGLARQAGDEIIAGLAEGYYLILTRPEALGATEGVRTIASALAGEDRVPPVAWKREARQVYEVSLAALQAISVPRIVALSASLGSLEDLSENPDFFLADTAQFLVELGQVSRTLSRLELVESNADQIAYLAEAMEILGHRDRQARTDLVGPEQTILIQIVATWLPIITGALVGLQGRAELTLALKTRRIVAGGEEVTLILALNNVGRAPASDLVVELLPGTGYVVSDALAEVPVLAAGRITDVELRVRPSPSIDAFRAEFRVTYDDRERAGKTELFADRVRLVAPPTVFRSIPNPYAAGKPLQAGSPVFVGREDVFAFICENLAGQAGENVLILVGERRMGKTSILRQLPLRLGESIIPVFIDGQGVGMEPGMANLLYDIGLEVQRSLAADGVSVELPPLNDFEARPTDAFERRLMAETRAALGDRTLLFLFDEFEELEARVRSGTLEEKVFAYLRHLMQHLEGIGFIFAGTHRLEELTADYWSTLFNIALYRRVGLLDENAARRLITEPVSEYGLVYDDLALDKMLKATAGHPYFLQLLCHTLINIHNRERVNYVTVGDVNRALEEMLELGEAHLAFLWERATPWERAILAALARLVSTGETGTAEAVATLLTSLGKSAGPTAIRQTLQRLEAQGTLQAVGKGGARYEFQVDLVRLWIERFKSLTQAVRGIQAPMN